MTDLGPLNRRGVLYQNVPTAGDGGAPVDNLVPLRSLPLTVDEGADDNAHNIGERITEVIDIIWKTRWFDGLKSDMFIISEGTTYQIRRVKELDRRNGWRIWASALG